jgi:hypothetical protein
MPLSSSTERNDSSSGASDTIENRLTDLLNGVINEKSNFSNDRHEIKTGEGIAQVSCNMVVLFSCYSDLTKHFGPFVTPVFDGLSVLGGRRAGDRGSMTSGSGSGRGKRAATVRRRRQVSTDRRGLPVLPGFGKGQLNSVEAISISLPTIEDLSEEDWEDMNFELGCRCVINCITIQK